MASSPDDVKRSQKHSNEKLLSLLEPDVPANRVSLNEDGRLMWPVLFLYPEHGQSELIEAFHEDSRYYNTHNYIIIFVKVFVSNYIGLLV